ncbi:WXG100 family type VII secretion target [Nocardia sp. NPDC004068]|uniref:WXG100 family type VII secretion target n=1 Tax=Nocardia sp. NPDC004068 TaxID=3364303 RepID=UPI003685E58A
MSEGGGNPDLSVVPDEVAKLGKYAYDLADILRSALADASREVTALTETGWTGTAAASFAEGWDECRDGGQRIIEALGTLAAAVGVTAETYAAHDNQFAAEVSSLDLS